MDGCFEVRLRFQGIVGARGGFFAISSYLECQIKVLKCLFAVAEMTSFSELEENVKSATIAEDRRGSVFQPMELHMGVSKHNYFLFVFFS